MAILWKSWQIKMQRKIFPYTFRVKDHRGNVTKVELTQKAFLEIRDGINHTGNPEIDTRFDEVITALSDPQQINHDKKKKRRMCWYGKKISREAHMKVVLEKKRIGKKLRFVTCYFKDRINPKEKILWQE